MINRIQICTLAVATLIFFFSGCDTQSNTRIQRIADSLSTLNHRIHLLDSSLRKSNWDLYFYKLQNEKGAVDFTDAGLQEIGNGFYVLGINLGQHLTGIKVKGRMLNGTSLAHSNAEFNLTIGDQVKDFTISSIPSQTAVSFNVYIPDVPVDQTHWGQIRYRRSLLNYYLK